MFFFLLEAETIILNKTQEMGYLFGNIQLYRRVTSFLCLPIDVEKCNVQKKEEKKCYA